MIVVGKVGPNVWYAALGNIEHATTTPMAFWVGMKVALDPLLISGLTTLNGNAVGTNCSGTPIGSLSPVVTNVGNATGLGLLFDWRPLVSNGIETVPVGATGK